MLLHPLFCFFHRTIHPSIQLLRFGKPGLIAFLLGLQLLISSTHAQAVFSQVNTNYSVDFNSMGTSSGATLPTGFRIGTNWSSGSSVNRRDRTRCVLGSLFRYLKFGLKCVDGK